MQQSSDLAGHIVGHYRILQPLASGGMATVYQAEDVHLHRLVAIKVFRPEAGETGTFLRRFAREAQVLASLDHPHILMVHDYGEQDGFAYLVMPLMTQGSLKAHVQPYQPLSIAEVLRLAEQILDALQYAHEHGLVHRDIKPANLLFKADGTLLLSDFGLVKILSDGNEQVMDVPTLVADATSPGTSPLAFAGTPQYMAPEQIQGQAVSQSDIYSVGVLLYELLTGRCPFVAEKAAAILVQHLTNVPRPLRELNPEIPASLEAAVMRALEKDPQHRYQSASEFFQALRVSQKLASKQADTTFSGREQSPQSPLTHAFQSDIDPFKTQAITDPSWAKELRSHPSSPAAPRRHRWVPLRVALPALLILLVAASPLGALAYQRYQSSRASLSLTPTATHHVTSTGTPTSLPLGGGLTPTPTLQTQCPKDENHANAAVTPVFSLGNHQNLVYLTRTSDQNGNIVSALHRYDVSTGQSHDMLNFASGDTVTGVQISGDGQWILFLVESLHTTKIQMVRIDGKYGQTLYCTSKIIRGILWSPDLSAVVFNVLSPTGVIQQDTPLTMDDLYIATGELHPILHATAGTGYDPLIWLNLSGMFYATNYHFDRSGGALTSLPKNLYLFDTTANQQRLISTTNDCQDYALSPDAAHLFISQCNPASGPQSPSSIQVQDISDPRHPSPLKTILSSSILAISHIAIISNTALLLEVYNNGSDTTHNGLWTINGDGTGLTQLTTSGLLAFNPLASGACQDAWTNISRDGQFYSVSDWQGSGLAYGSLRSHGPKVIPLATGSASVIGWTTM